ncbi:UNVERIFIED_CONTAM: hypothetical protein Sindi_1654900 [Sesamum indicum]
MLLKIDQRIKGWEGMALSYTSRSQIIKYVLMALSVYWASAFLLPKGVIREIEKRLRTFLWKGTKNSGYAKIAWRDVCKPTDEGGQGLLDLATLNRALMCKKLRDVTRCDRTSILGGMVLSGSFTRDIHLDSIGPWGLVGLEEAPSPTHPNTVDGGLSEGDRSSFYLWQDPWHDLGPLLHKFP